MTVAYADMYRELEDADVLHSRLAFVEGIEGLSWNGKPTLLLLTDKRAYIGGTKETGFSFHVLALSDIESVEKDAIEKTPCLRLGIIQDKERIEIRLCLSQSSLDVEENPEGIEELAGLVRQLAQIR